MIGEPDVPYLHRGCVIPRNRWLTVYLHTIVSSRLLNYVLRLDAHKRAELRRRVVAQRATRSAGTARQLLGGRTSCIAETPRDLR